MIAARQTAASAYSGAMATRRGVGQGKGGGPKTRDGKESSRKNSLKHGLCAGNAEVLILPDEHQSDFEAVERGWREEYQPTGHAEEMLVNELILNEWALRRARRKLMEAEASADEEWSAEAAHKLELRQRYKTTAERSFYRSWNAVQGLRKDRQRMFEKEHKTQEKLRDIDARITKMETLKAREPAARESEAPRAMGASRPSGNRGLDGATQSGKAPSAVRY